MITIAAKEVYKLDIKIGVNGDKESSSKIKKVEETTEKAEKKMKSLDRVTASPTARLRDQLTSPLTKLESKINSFAAAATKRLIAFGTAASVALGGIGAVSTVKTFANWEASMSNVKALTGATTDELNKLAEKSKDLGARTSKTAKEAADAMGYQALAGWNVNQIMSSTEPILRLSEAANSDLAHTSDLVTDSMSAMGVQTEQLGRYLDIVAQTQASANTTADGMLDAYIGAGGMFKSFNTPLEESAALLGVLANRGIKGSEAGTSLNSILINLMGTTKRTSAALQQLGVKAYDEHGNFRGVETTLRDVKDAMVGLTDEQEDMLSANLGGKTQIDTLKALLSGLGEEYDTLKEKVTNSDGALNRMAETMQDNLKGQWTRLKSAVEGAQIDLGEKLAPYMKQFVTWFTNKIPDIKEGILSFVDYISKNTDKLLALGKAAVTVTGSIMALSLVSKTLGAINGISGFIASIRTIQTGAEVATHSLSLAGIAARALPALFSPIGLAAVASTALVTSAFSGASDLMERTVANTQEDLGVMENIFNQFGGSVIKTKKEMQNLGLITKDFSKGISNQFINGVKEGTKEINKLEFSLAELQFDRKMDETDQNRFRNYINDFTYNAINLIKEKKSQVQETLSNAFKLDNNVTDAETGTLDYFSRYYEEAITTEQKIRDEINDIAEKSISKNGRITDDAMTDIKNKITQIKQLQLELTEAQNEYDREYAKNKFSEEAKGLTIANAEDLLTQYYGDAETSRKDTVANYKTAIKEIQRQLSNGVDLNGNELSETDRSNLEQTLKENTDNLNNAEKAYGETIKGYYEEAIRQNPNLEGRINKYTGKAFDAYGKGAYGGLDEIKKTYKSLEDINEEGWYDLYNSITGKREKAYVTTQQWGDTKEVSGVSVAGGKSAGYTGNEEDKAIAKTTEYDNLNRINLIDSDGIAYAYDKASGLKQEITELQQITTDDGVSRWVKQIGDHFFELKEKANGAGMEVIDLGEELNKIPSDVTTNVDTNADEAAGPVEKFKSIVDSIDRNVTVSFQTKIASVVGEGAGAAFSDALSSVMSSVGYASGTDDATAGLHPVAEEGFEIVTNPSIRNFKGGEKVLNHDESIEFLKNRKKVQQGTYQVAQAPVQVAGVGGLNFGDTNININGNQDVEAMIQQAMIQFGNTLRSAFSNIKK